MGAIIYLVFGVAFGATGIYLVRKRWRFTDTPTSDAAHVFPGMSEVHGVAEAAGEPIVSPLDGTPCVYWSYKVERQIRTKNSTRWVTEEHGVSTEPFLVRDQSGTVRVVADENTHIAGLTETDVEHMSLAALRPHARTMTETYEPGAVAKAFGSVFGSNTADEPITEFSGTWRAHAFHLAVGDPVFIAGHARLTPDLSEVEFAGEDADGERRPLDMIRGDEKAAVDNFAGGFGIVLMSALSIVLAGMAGNELFGGGVVLLPAIYLALVGVVFLVGAWNRLRRARERCLFAWSLIDIASEQRANLVPQLQAVVGAAFAHERDVLEAVAAARQLGRAPSAASVGSVQAADAATAHLVAGVEARPELSTQANVAQLMEQVRLLTDRVAFGERFYNDSVLRLRNRLGQFPDGLLATLARVTALPYLEPREVPLAPPPAA